MQFRFSIRDVLWLTAVVALAAQIMKSPIVLPTSVVVIVAVLLLLVAIVGISRNPRIRRLANYRLVFVSTDSNERFWPSLHDLADTFGDDRQQSKDAVQRCGHDYLNLEPSVRAGVRSQINSVLQGLTLLEAQTVELEAA